MTADNAGNGQSFVGIYAVYRYLFMPAHSFNLHPFVGPWPFFSKIIIFTQTIGLLGRVISPSQIRYLYREQHKHRINAHVDIHVLSGIRTPDSSVRASEDSSCLRSRGYCDWHVRMYILVYNIYVLL
jgi:hypothetical protein